MRYKVWVVYETAFTWDATYYIINTETKKMHSIWNDWSQAHKMNRELNAWVKKKKVA